jgi:hypothetical protein
MNYTKPQILVLAEAAAAVRSGLDKSAVQGDSENIGPKTGAAAYEADE